MRAKRKHTLHIGMLAITLLMAAGSIYAIRLPAEQEERGLWVGHTREVLYELDKLERHINEAETSQRGYLLTNEDDYIAPYENALQQISAEIDHIQHLTRDNPEQQNRLTQLQHEIAQKLAELQKTIDQHKKLSAKEAVRVVLSDFDKRQMEIIRQQIGAMKTGEDILLKARSETWHEAALRTRTILLVAGALVYALVCLVFIILRKEVKHRERLSLLEQVASNLQRSEVERMTQIVALQREVTGNQLEVEKVMTVITERVQRLTEASGAIVEMLDGDEMVYRAASGAGSPHHGLRLKAQGSLSGLCIKENTILKCDDAETDDRVNREACRKVGLRSMVVVPLRHNGQSVGVLKVLSSISHAFTPEHIATLELMAAVLSAVLSDAIVAERIRATNNALASVNATLTTRKSELESANARLEVEAATDGLTGLKNRRIFQERLAEEFERNLRYKAPLSLILLDVDYFKKFNDSFGHPAGDAVLKRVGAILINAARVTDCVARYGGEEFALLLPETDADGAGIIAERIRKLVEDNPWEHRAVTVSVGVCTVNPAVPTAAALLEAADKALYASKRDGRNRVTIGLSATEAAE